jgi:hypothetical protein
LSYFLSYFWNHRPAERSIVVFQRYLSVTLCWPFFFPLLFTSLLFLDFSLMARQRDRNRYLLINNTFWDSKKCYKNTRLLIWIFLENLLLIPISVSILWYTSPDSGWYQTWIHSRSTDVSHMLLDAVILLHLGDRNMYHRSRSPLKD